MLEAQNVLENIRFVLFRQCKSVSRKFYQKILFFRKVTVTEKI